MLLKVDFKSGQPVHAQLIAQIRTAIASGILRPAEPLPAIADLAAQLRVNRNNVAKAYSELESLGIIELIPGKGYCLKEEHRPVRKNVTRTDDIETVKPRLHRTVSQEFARALPETLAMLVYLSISAAASMIALRYLPLHSETFTMFVTLIIAALTLPLRKAIKAFVDRKIFPKRHRMPLILHSLKEGNTGLDALLECIRSACNEFIRTPPNIIRDGADVAASVNQFPALRASLGPVVIGDDLLTPLFSHDEIIAILELKSAPGKRFDSDDWEFLIALGAEFTAAASRLQLRKERAESEYALEIQRGLLPRNIPQVPGFTIAGAWQPAKDASGDYYDVFRLNENEIALIVADVSGKGAPAALLMSNVQATTKAYASSTSAPAELTARVNAAICASITAGKFVTFFYAVLNTDKRMLTYCNAGHNPPLIVTHNGDRCQLETGGTVLGLFPEAQYEQASVDLHAGDRLLIFTDGVLEAADSSEREFGEDRLFTAMTANANATASDLRDSIMQAVTRFCHGDFSDDATLLTVVVNAAGKSAAASAV